MPIKGEVGELGQFADLKFKGGLGKKDGCGVFRGVNTPMHTMTKDHNISLHKLSDYKIIDLANSWFSSFFC